MKFWTFILFSFLVLGCAEIKDGPDAENSQGGDGNPVVNVNDPQDYFARSVVPALQQPSQCISCHKLPKDGGNGNLQPFNYTYMRNLMVTGPVNNSRTTLDNGVMRYLLGQVSTHVAGTFCFGDLSTAPCSQIREWSRQEGLKVADVGTGGSGAAPYGRVNGTELDGVIWGWAADPDTANTPMTVEFYVNGDRTTGTRIGTAVADRSFYTAEKSGNAGYRFVMPNLYRDGVTRSIRVYGADNNTPGTFYQLTGSPVNVTAYLPDAAAKAYYTANVVPFVTSRNCTSCHSSSEFDYDYAFYGLMLRPPPHLGGTATTNTFYKKMFGSESHRGGSPCGGNANAAPCNFLSNTWNQEFN